MSNTNKPKYELSGDLEKDVKIPYLIKGKTLMSPGIWNNFYYSGEQIHEAFVNTDWADKEIRSLFSDHEDRRSREWIGEVINVREMSGHKIIGDLVVVDKPTAIKLAYGAKMGISPKVRGKDDGGQMLKFRFENMSVVINPAVKTAYINNQQKEEIIMANEEEKKIPEQEEVKEEVKEEAKEEVKVEAPAVEAEAKPEAEAPANAEVENSVKEVTLSDVMAQLSKVVELLQKKEEVKEEEKVEVKENAEMKPEEVKPVPKPAEEVKKVEVKKEEPVVKKEEMSESVQKMQQELKEKISELSEKLEQTEAKLNEPAKETVKAEAVSEMASNGNPDKGMLNLLKSMRGFA